MLNALLIATFPGLNAWAWADYRLAVLFSVIIPLILLIWAFVSRIEAIQKLLIIYWRVASLLAITVYLMIAAIPVGFIAAIASRLLIPICLWFWVDLNEEIREMQPSPLRTGFTAWRWAMTGYNLLGALLFLPSVQCAFLKTRELVQDPSCRVWLDAPWMYREIFHPNLTPQFLGFLGLVGLIFYVAFLSYFVLVKFKRQGRSATGY
ncbi:MAG: DUF3177 family protein [Microcoleaceae cyanobacterium]